PSPASGEANIIGAPYRYSTAWKVWTELSRHSMLPGVERGFAMNSHYRAVVIGGGVVGASVLYHLTKLGWSDVVLIERSVLTAGSSWHAAGGFHALNANPNMAVLQAYTIDLLSEIEKESGQAVGMHMTGGISVASAPERWEWLKAAYRTFQA